MHKTNIGMLHVYHGHACSDIHSDIHQLLFQGEGQDGKLHTSSNTTGYARQRSVFDRQGQEDKQRQNAQDKEHLHSKTPLVKLKLNAQAPQNAPGDSEGGVVHVELESWISRAMSKAKDKTKL